MKRSVGRLISDFVSKKSNLFECGDEAVEHYYGRTADPDVSLST